ncbi:MAG: hypothetical protein B7C54_11060 [Acidimicrobiales bacterium mtb01]|nr:hypothetical protein [Actinomycetota bacterium]TEX45593.1 MAG: hypothetical protein B7C54_11060 [Acidimicrobiales bacterium mtb01]
MQSPLFTRIRIVTGVMFVASIAGLIISSIAGNNEGWVVTIGVVSAITAVVLIVGSAVASSKRIPAFSEVEAERIEEQVRRLVSAGADENDVRELVKTSIRLGRGL